VVLTKIDTLTPAEGEAARARVSAQLTGHIAAYPEVLASSAETGEGLVVLKRQLTALVTA
jgi:GTP-binding protein